MSNATLRRGSRPFAALVAGAAVWTLCLVNVGTAQRSRTSAVGTIDPGTTIAVRTVEAIDAKESDGRVFPGVVDQDVLNRNGRVAIPQGSDVELIVRNTSDNQIALDLDSVTVNGQRYGVQTDSSVIGAERKEGVGANGRTGKYVGGGAAIGAIIGAITGGGKGAAIGAGVGAAAGAGTQVLTRGGSVKVPSETLLTFRLDQPLQAGTNDGGFTTNGIHYHPGYSSSSVAGAGKPRPGSPPYNAPARAGIHIGADKSITWSGPATSRVLVQVDNTPFRLFASGASGTQMADWIEQGHRYVFILQDADGNEVARDVQDLRTRRR